MSWYFMNTTDPEWGTGWKACATVILLSLILWFGNFSKFFSAVTPPAKLAATIAYQMKTRESF
jgi:hypothetical protein